MLLAVKLDALTWGGPRAQANCQVSLRGALWSTEKILCQVVAVLKAATKTSQNNHFDCTWHCRCSQPFAAGISKVRSCFFLKVKGQEGTFGLALSRPCDNRLISDRFQPTLTAPQAQRHDPHRPKAPGRFSIVSPVIWSKMSGWQHHRWSPGDQRRVKRPWCLMDVWWCLCGFFDGSVWWICLVNLIDGFFMGFYGNSELNDLPEDGLGM